MIKNKANIIAFFICMLLPILSYGAMRQVGKGFKQATSKMGRGISTMQLTPIDKTSPITEQSGQPKTTTMTKQTYEPPNRSPLSEKSKSGTSKKIKKLQEQENAMVEEIQREAPSHYPQIIQDILQKIDKGGFTVQTREALEKIIKETRNNAPYVAPQITEHFAQEIKKGLDSEKITTDEFQNIFTLMMAEDLKAIFVDPSATECIKKITKWEKLPSLSKEIIITAYGDGSYMFFNKTDGEPYPAIILNAGILGTGGLLGIGGLLRSATYTNATIVSLNSKIPKSEPIDDDKGARLLAYRLENQANKFFKSNLDHYKQIIDLAKSVNEPEEKIAKAQEWVNSIEELKEDKVFLVVEDIEKAHDNFLEMEKNLQKKQSELAAEAAEKEKIEKEQKAQKETEEKQQKATQEIIEKEKAEKEKEDAKKLAEKAQKEEEAAKLAEIATKEIEELKSLPEAVENAEEHSKNELLRIEEEEKETARLKAEKEAQLKAEKEKEEQEIIAEAEKEFEEASSSALEAQAEQEAQKEKELELQAVQEKSEKELQALEQEEQELLTQQKQLEQTKKEREAQKEQEEQTLQSQAEQEVKEAMEREAQAKKEQEEQALQAQAEQEVKEAMEREAQAKKEQEERALQAQAEQEVQAEVEAEAKKEFEEEIERTVQAQAEQEAQEEIEREYHEQQAQKAKKEQEEQALQTQAEQEVQAEVEREAQVKKEQEEQVLQSQAEQEVQAEVEREAQVKKEQEEQALQTQAEQEVQAEIKHEAQVKKEQEEQVLQSQAEQEVKEEMEREAQEQPKQEVQAEPERATEKEEKTEGDGDGDWKEKKEKEEPKKKTEEPTLPITTAPIIQPPKPTESVPTGEQLIGVEKVAPEVTLLSQPFVPITTPWVPTETPPQYPAPMETPQPEIPQQLQPWPIPQPVIEQPQLPWFQPQQPWIQQYPWTTTGPKEFPTIAPKKEKVAAKPIGPKKQRVRAARERTIQPPQQPEQRAPQQYQSGGTSYVTLPGSPFEPMKTGITQKQTTPWRPTPYPMISPQYTAPTSYAPYYPSSGFALEQPQAPEVEVSQPVTKRVTDFFSKMINRVRQPAIVLWERLELVPKWIVDHYRQIWGVKKLEKEPLPAPEEEKQVMTPAEEAEIKEEPKKEAVNPILGAIKDFVSNTISYIKGLLGF